MKKLITLLLVIFSVTNLYAQNRVTDSLKLLLSEEKTDTGRVSLLIAIGSQSAGETVRNDLSVGYLQKALSIARQNKLTVMEIKVFHALAVSYLNLNRDSSFYWMHQALYLARKYDLKKEEIEILESLLGRGGPMLEVDSVEQNFKRGIALARQIHSQQAESNFLIGYGFVFFSRGDYFKSLNANFQVLNLMKQENNKPAILLALYAIGNTYYTIQDYRQSLSYLFEGKKLAVEIKHAFLSAFLVKISSNYIKIGQPDSARIFAEEAYQVASHFNPGHIVGGLLNDLGNVYIDLGEDSLAMVYFRQSFPNFNNDANLKRNICESLLGMAKIFNKSSQPDSVFHYAAKAFGIANENNYLEYILEASNLLTGYYNSRHLIDSSFKYQGIEMVTRDSLFGEKKIRQIEKINFAEQLHQQELNQKLLQAGLQYKNRVRIYVLIGGLLVLLLIAIALFHNNRNKRKANTLLRQQKEEIQSTLSELKSTQKQLIQSEKMASLGELTAGIAHEIQNPLNFVNNFSDVNKELLEELKAERLKQNAERDEQTEDELINDVIANEEKINHHGKRADAIVKGMLQHSRASSGQKELTDINALADEYLRLSYHGLRAKDKSFNATMKTDFDELIGRINIIPQDIGRVLLNLFNNAFYACAERSRSAVNQQKSENLILYEPTVTVRTSLNPPLEGREASVLITVSDNGNGISQKVVDKIFQPFFTTKPTGEGTGLGLSLAYDIVKAHGGELKVNTKEGEGSEFVIQLPI